MFLIHRLSGVSVYTVFTLSLTRFNKIAIPNNKAQMASGQGSHWLIESTTIVIFYV